MHLRKNKPPLNYAGRAPAVRLDRERFRDAAVAFVVATACACVFLFGFTEWVMLARAGSRLYGPQDQYVDLGHAINALVSGVGMCVIGGAIFLSVLLIARRPTDDLGIGAASGAASGLLYVIAFATIVRILEQLAGPNVGGPTTLELIGMATAGATYPAVAAYVLARR